MRRLVLALAVFLAVIARPLVVTLCLAPFRAFTRRDVAYVDSRDRVTGCERVYRSRGRG